MDFLVSLLFSNPLVPYIFGLLVLLVAYQQIATRFKIRVPGSNLTPDDLLRKLLGSRYAQAKMEKQVMRYRGQGQYLAAGKMLEDNEQLAEAVEVYADGGEYWAAASLLEKLGQHERAAELYLQAGDHKKAAQLLSEKGKPAKAAALFLEKGNTLEAARLFSLAGEWAKAADLYHKGGYPLRAAEAYEKLGDFVKAAQCQERHFMENVSYSTTYSSTAPSADQRSALLAGRLYQKAGDLPHALQIFEKGGYFKDAGEASMALGKFTHAAELFMRAGQPSQAADAYQRAGDGVQASNLRGEVALKEERVPDAAAFFQEGRDYLRAAELYESVDLLAQAASAYEAGESYAAAGSVYIRAGLKDRAAASYERAGEYETAAKLYEEVGNGAKAIELFEKAGFTFKSGEAAAKAGEREKAIALLQRVSSTDENYFKATEVLARLFLEGGKPGLAVERIQKTLGGQGISPANIDLHYWMGVAQEMAGRKAEALDLYRKVLAEDVAHGDVEQRAARLEAGGSPLPIPRLAEGHPATAAASPARAAVAPAQASVSKPSAPAPAPASAPAPAAAPSRPVRFVLKEEIGRGPLGTVFRGEDKVDGRSVAVRVLPAEILKAPGTLAALAGDLKAAAQVSHPNLVKVLGFIELDGQRCLVSEFVTGRHLADALRGGHKMTVQQVHSLARVLAQVLSFVHARNLVHGSIQPSNIMVTSGVVKVADLGLGRLAHGLAAPDRYRAAEDGLDAASDLYALAAVLYHLLTGVHPRSQPQGVAMPLPSTLAAGVSEALDKLLLRCLHPRRELRFGSADEVLQELKGMVRIV